VRDALLIALFAFLGATTAGVLGAGVLLLIRRRISSRTPARCSCRGTT
jgi:hypothetical protein